VPAAGFSVREYARTAVGSHRDAMDLAPFADRPLTPATVRALRYLAASESGTMGHLRNVLVTATHKDARVTAFLGTWAFEKYWTADALDQVVAAHDASRVPSAAAPSRLRSFVGEVRERVRPITGSITANRLGEHMVAVHMAAGAIDEWLTRAALERVVELDPHPALRTVVDRLLEVKGRQLEFFEAQARDRLSSDARTRAVVRRRLRGIRWPMGADGGPVSESLFFSEYLFSGAPASMRAVDALVDTLPGQKGLSLISRAFSARSRTDRSRTDRRAGASS
jgi:hypothetical protein